jgi:ABC-type Zn uptake system ZnuABC Zn-binding protein ZnuA
VGEKIAKFHRRISSLYRKKSRENFLTEARSWQYLEYHAEICFQLAKILVEKHEGNKEKSREQWRKLKVFLQENEDQMQPVFDLFEYIETMERRILSQ